MSNKVSPYYVILAEGDMTNTSVQSHYAFSLEHSSIMLFNPHMLKDNFTDVCVEGAGFSGSMVLSVTLPDETGSHKSKMAAEILLLHVSQVIYMIATKFQRLSHVFGVRQHKKTHENTVRRLGML